MPNSQSVCDSQQLQGAELSAIKGLPTSQYVTRSAAWECKGPVNLPVCDSPHLQGVAMSAIKIAACSSSLLHPSCRCASASSRFISRHGGAAPVRSIWV
jgi:hypothetical protein